MMNMKSTWLSSADYENYKGMTHNIFHVLDTNGDGFITMKEWKAHAASAAIALETAEAPIKAMDSDGDGMVTHQHVTITGGC